MLLDKHIILSDKGDTFLDKDVFWINVKKVDWSRSFSKQFNLASECQRSVSVRFVLQDHRYIIRIIKNIDSLLRSGSEILITLFDNKSHSKTIRSLSQVKHALSVATNGRYIHSSCKSKGRVTTLSYKKIKPFLISNDEIDKWSFGIVSNGTKNDWVIEQVKSIVNQNINNYEILICGPSPFKENNYKNDKVKLLDDVVLDDMDIRAPICHKKNLIINESRYNNLCIMHDRFLLPKDWFENIVTYGNYFDILCLKVVNKNNKRIPVDWMRFGCSLTALYKRNATLLYDDWHEDVIIPGGAFIVKKNLIKNFTFDERLHWDEMEDIHFSKLLSLNGFLIDIDKNNYFITREVRQFSQNSSWLRLKIFSYFYWVKSAILIMIDYKKTKIKFYKNFKS